MSFKNKVNISVLISLLSVILLLFVIGVYAQDNSTVITNGTDINTTSINNTNNSVREVNVHNWNELKASVDNLTAHPCEKLVINLEEGDYKMNTKQIDVKRGQNVVINGNGHTINCNQKHFMDIINGGTVTINNLTVQNAEVRVDGGAIWNIGGNLIVQDSTFNNNHAGRNGGAIYNKGGTLTITSSTFTNNHAGGNGGAICSISGKVNPIKDCTFKNNIVQFGAVGGAIKCTGNNDPLIVTDCQFIGNHAEDGGAIDCRVLQIKNCVFIENKALDTSCTGSHGGAVNCNDLNECTGCNFTSNTAETNGGAIAIMEKAGINYIRDCVFKDNKAANFGGVIFVNKRAAHISIVHNQFIDNYATSSANTVFNWGTYDKIEYNYFSKGEQNSFLNTNGASQNYVNDKHPFYNLEDYYKWKG